MGDVKSTFGLSVPTETVGDDEKSWKREVDVQYMSYSLPIHGGITWWVSCFM